MKMMKSISCLLFLSITVSLVSTGESQGRRPKGPRSFTETFPESRRGYRVNTSPVPIEEPEECRTKCLDPRFLQHYVALGCKPIDGEIQYCNRPCPKYFECPVDSIKHHVKKNSTAGCFYKNKVYPVGADIPFANPCQKCKCFQLSETFEGSPDGLSGLSPIQNVPALPVGSPKITRKFLPEIQCASVECPEMWGNRGGIAFPGQEEPSDDKCYHKYEHDKCCGEKTCLNEVDAREMNKCVYNKKEYKQGEQIYPEEDNCLKCICGEGWNATDPVKSKGCQKIDCNLEFEMNREHRKGCTPIYHEGTCCPIDWQCPTPMKEKCHFDGNYYRIGSKLDIGGDTPCVTCECKVPPQFTCIKQSCPTPPMPEPDCVMKFPIVGCCPEYDCPKLKDSCFVDNTLHARNSTWTNGCSTCTCSDPPSFSCVSVPCSRPSNWKQCTATDEEGKCCPVWKCPDINAGKI